MTAITDLPTELLQRIFISGCEIDEDPILTSAYGRLPTAPYLSTYDEMHPRAFRRLGKPWLKSFALNLTAVCRQWNGVVNDTPQLWYIVAVLGSDGTLYESSMEWIGSSGAVDVDIQYYSTGPNPSTPSELERLASLIKACRTRIRSIDASEDNETILHKEVVGILNDIGTLPNLEFIGLGPSRPGHFPAPTSPVVPLVLTAKTPALKCLGVRRATVLQLRPEWQIDRARGILRAPPPSTIHVQYDKNLVLEWWRSPMPINDPLHQTLEFPSVRALHLQSHYPRMADILSNIHLPYLETMELTQLTSYIDDLPDLKGDVQVYPNLTTLSLNGRYSTNFGRIWKQKVKAEKLRTLRVKEESERVLKKNSWAVIGCMAGGHILHKHFTIEVKPAAIFNYPIDPNVDVAAIGLDIYCCNILALDMILIFSDLEKVTTLRITRSRGARQVEDQVNPGMRWNGVLPALRSISLISSEYGVLPSLFRQTYFAQITSLEIVTIKDPLIFKDFLRQLPMVEELKIRVGSKQVECLNALVELENIPLHVMVWNVFSTPESPGRTAVVFPKLRNLQLVIHYMDAFLGEEDKELSWTIIKRVVSKRAETNVKLERFRVDRTVSEELKRCCELHGVEVVCPPLEKDRDQVFHPSLDNFEQWMD